MKKYLLLSGAIMILALAGCSKTENTTDQIATTNDTTTQETLPTNDTTMCSKVIKDYLAKADLKGKGDKKVEKGHQVTVHYVGRLDDKNVFDTSVEEIAKACGKHNPARNYNEGLAFTVGAGQMIAGFDKGVEGMKIGQTKTVTIPAKEAYGEWTGAAVITVERSQLPTGDYQPGVKLSDGMGRTFTVTEVKGENVTLDGNHELAGKDLIFDITVLEIK